MRHKLISRTVSGNISHTYIEMNRTSNTILINRVFFSSKYLDDPGFTLLRKYGDKWVYFCVMPFLLESFTAIAECAGKFFFNSKN